MRQYELTLPGNSARIMVTESHMLAQGWVRLVDLERATEQMDDLNEECQSLRGQVDDQDDTIWELESQVKILDDSINDLEDQITTLEQQLEAISDY